MTHLQASAPSDLWTGEYRAYDHPNSGDDGDGFVSSSESELDDDSSGSENSDDENEGQAAAADAGPEEEEQELRYDTDGSMHSFSAFTEYYGPEEGARLWEFAAVARPASAASSSSLQPKRDKQPHHSHRRSSQRSHNGSRPSHSSGSSMRNSSQMEPPWSRFVAMQTTGKAPLDDRDPRIAAAFQSFLEAEAEANALREKEQGRAQVAALGQALETRRVKSTVILMLGHLLCAIHLGSFNSLLLLMPMMLLSVAFNFECRLSFVYDHTATSHFSHISPHFLSAHAVEPNRLAERSEGSVHWEMGGRYKSIPPTAASFAC